MGAGGKSPPFACAVEADGGLYVSRQVAMVDCKVEIDCVAYKAKDNETVLENIFENHLTK